MKLKYPYMLIIYGPTGCGKTDFSLALAKKLPIAVLNMDVGQFYTPLTVGTAKPDWRSFETKHTLFDIINEPSNISAFEYRNMVQREIEYIWSQGMLPVLVGGSGFYLKSLFFPPLAELKKRDNSLDLLSAEQLLNKLEQLDPDRAKVLHPNDIYRIKRALTICNDTGNKASSYSCVYQPLSPYTLVWLDRERQELYQRINRRVEHMLAHGWIEETKSLRGTVWQDFLQQKKIIGYDTIFTYLSLEQDIDAYESMATMIAQKTRNYAKKQITFWASLKKILEKELKVAGDSRSEIICLDLTYCELDLYINQLTEKLKVHFI